VAARRREVSPQAAAAAARAASERLIADPRFAAARRVALYAALADELPTRPLFEALASGGGILLFPRSSPGPLLEFARVERWEDLRPGRYGVLEPSAGAAAVELGEEDAVVVPGVAFDRAGNRLGRGRGYFDRTFPPGAARAPLLVGFAHQVQLLESVPHGAGDRAVDAVCTDRAVYWPDGARERLHRPPRREKSR
jgi:5-formyltetrahydrofolate cyclo-ligase